MGLALGSRERKSIDLVLDSKSFPFSSSSQEQAEWVVTSRMYKVGSVRIPG